MTKTNEQNLFSGDPIGDLSRLIQKAKDQEATRLLLLAGKQPVCRVKNKLSPPVSDERLHFSQTETLANALLTDDQKTDLDNAGAIEIVVELPGESYPCSVFYGNGSHNVIVFLSEEA